MTRKTTYFAPELRDRVSIAFAKHHGYSGGIDGIGGNDLTGEYVCQDWCHFYRIKGREIRDWMVRRYTGFTSLEAMLTAAGGYRPTISLYGPRDQRDAQMLMAFIYDNAQIARRDPRRAYTPGMTVTDVSVIRKTA